MADTKSADLGSVFNPSVGDQLLFKQSFKRSKSSPQLASQLFAWCLVLQIVLQSPFAVVLGIPGFARGWHATT